MDQLLTKNITEYAKELSQGEYSSRELTEAFLGQIADTDGEIGAFVTLCADTALSLADASDKRRKNGENLGLLDGIPFALKDNICTAGIRTTCSSRMLADYVPPYNAFVYDRLLANGAVLLGKLNMDEFAMGSSTESSAFGITKNPVNTDCVPGGSSGGSAAAVAANQAVYTLGSDTGGSIRQPAAFCGAVGIKPTYGRVSRSGLVAFASSLDQIGPISKTVRDNAIVLSAVSGVDAKDSTTRDLGDLDFTSMIGKDVRGMRIGFAPSLAESVAPDIKAALFSAAASLQSMGAEIVELALPNVEKMLAAYHIISCAEASSNLARFDGVRYGHRAENCKNIEELWVKSRSEGFRETVKRRILLGVFSLSHGAGEEYYKNALAAREEITHGLRGLFERCDIMLMPVTPTTAYSLRAHLNPLEASTSDIFCVGANLSGLPAISIPAGKDRSGLPIGIQLMGPAASETVIYRVASALEEVL